MQSGLGLASYMMKHGILNTGVASEAIFIGSDKSDVVYQCTKSHWQMLCCMRLFVVVYTLVIVVLDCTSARKL